MREAYVQRFIDGYIDCMLWAGLDISGLDESGDLRPLDENYGRADFTDEAITKITEDCREFIGATEADLSYVEDELPMEPEGAGHDYYLTRERHGAGYWDRYYGDDTALKDALKRLSDASQSRGEVYVEPYGDFLDYRA